MIFRLFFKDLSLEVRFCLDLHLWTAFKLLLLRDPFYNGGTMKRVLNIKVFIAVIFFCLGFLTNHYLVKIKNSPGMAKLEMAFEEERFPVNPADFDHSKMLDSFAGASALGIVSQREDDKNVYYEVPLAGADGVNRKLNVEIKEGMIKINEDVKDHNNGVFETSSERMFSIDPMLDADKAEVINEKDKIVIRIPKK